MEKEVNNRTQEIHHEDALIEFVSSEFTEHERTIIWYLVFGAVLLSVAGYSVYVRDWFILIIVPVVAVAVLKSIKIKPKMRKYSFYVTGISIDDYFYSYDEIHSFWIIYTQRTKTLNFMLRRKIMPVISVNIQNENPNTLKIFFKKFLPEEEKMQESLIDRMIHFLKM